MMRKTTTDSNEKKWKIAAVILFLVWAAAGAFLFDDYGCGPDEGMERQTSLVNFRYVVHKLNIPISAENESWLSYLPELHEYRDRYYGTALHFPLVLIESFFHFTLEPSQFYGMRHLYTFLNYFLGVFCFYRLLGSRFGSRKYGIAGMLMMVLAPRFYAESFYNNKDVIFAAWYVITAYVMVRWFSRRDLKTTVLLAFCLALTCNTRFNGIVFIPVFIFLYGFDVLRTKKPAGLRLFCVTLLLFLFFFYLITPNFWEHPVQTLAETLQFNMHHPNHGSEGNLFKGLMVDAARTYTFVPVWIGLTVPSVYLLFSLAGTALFCLESVKRLVRARWREQVPADLLMFISGFGALVFIVLMHVTIYNGWRHCYFAYPCIVYFAVYALSAAGKLRVRAVRIFCPVLLGAAFVYNSCWIAVNHPFEYAYFAPVFRSRAQEFSGDYWGISSRALLEFITGSDPERMLLINHAETQAGSINRGLLPEDERKYLTLTYDRTDDVDYYIVCRDDKPDTGIGQPGYDKVFSVTVDSDEIGAVYKRMTSGEE